MRAVMLGAALLVGIVMASPAPAEAHDWKRLERACHHGDQHACHMIELRHRCDRGDRHACRELR